MKTYQVTFYGREKGAIGIFYLITDTFNAKNENDLRNKMYDKYEHIRIETITEKEFKL